MKVNISVCGKFHFGNYVKFLEEKNLLNAFYYSHKFSSDYNSLGINKEHAHNYAIKEYSTYIQRKVFKLKFKEEIYSFLFKLWENNVLTNWKHADVYHYVNHGNSLKIVQKALSQNSIVIGECVNSHIDYMSKLMTEEYELLGMDFTPKRYSWENRMIDELAITPNILTPSNFVKKSLVEKGFNESSIKVIPYGANLSRFYAPSQKINKKKFRVLVVAQISPRKGHKYLLEAWKKLNLPDAELVFIGALTPGMDSVLKQYEGLFTYKGIIANDQLVHEMHESDVFVLPSIEEGCSVAPLEAMACGLPVILTENTGADAYFKEGVNGFVIPIRNVDILAERIEKLYMDKLLREEMSQRNILDTKKDLGWNKYAENLMEYYRSLYQA